MKFEARIPKFRAWDKIDGMDKRKYAMYVTEQQTTILALERLLEFLRKNPDEWILERHTFVQGNERFVLAVEGELNKELSNCIRDMIDVRRAKLDEVIGNVFENPELLEGNDEKE